MAKSAASERLAIVWHAHSWNDLIRLQHKCGERGKWIYRGHQDGGWELETTLERAIKRFDIGTSKIRALEGGLIRQFARRAHHYLSDVPPRDQWVEWMALMQHHGAPTRLLDFSYSFFVGLFFALEHAGPDQECALWIVDVDWLSNQIRRKVGNKWFGIYDHEDRNIEDARTFKEFLAADIKMVFGLNPYRLNQRLSIQQGIFLCPGDVSVPFHENLRATGATKSKVVKCKIRLDRKNYQDCIQRLIRMNMTRTTLFPGMDGFATSQALAIANPHILVPEHRWPR